MNDKRMKTILILALLFPVLAVKAQVELTRLQCREMALQNSKEIQIAGKQQQKAVYTRKSYRADYLPKLSAKGVGFYNRERYSYSLGGGYLPAFVPDAQGKLQPDVKVDPVTGNPVIGPDGKPVFNQYAFLPDIAVEVGMRGVYMAGVQLEQPLYMGGKIRAAYRMAKVGEQIAEENIRLNRSEIAVASDEAFWQLLRVQEQVLAAQKYRQVVQELLKNLNNAMATGMATRNDVLKAQVKSNEAGLMLQKAQNGLVLAQMNLCRIIGLDLQTRLHIKDTLPETISAEIWGYNGDVSQRPDYHMLAHEVDLKSKEVGLARADFLPQLGVTAGYGYGGGLELNGKGDANASFNAMAALDIPVFHWGEGRNKVKTAKMDQEISQLNLKKSADLMELEVASARFNIKDAQTRVEMCRNALIQAKENVRVTTDQYQVGLENLTNLLEAQAQWQEAWSQWIDSKTMLQLSETKYLKSIGRLVE